METHTHTGAEYVHAYVTYSQQGWMRTVCVQNIFGFSPEPVDIVLI